MLLNLSSNLWYNGLEVLFDLVKLGRNCFYCAFRFFSQQADSVDFAVNVVDLKCKGFVVGTALIVVGARRYVRNLLNRLCAEQTLDTTDPRVDAWKCKAVQSPVDRGNFIKHTLECG